MKHNIYAYHDTALLCLAYLVKYHHLQTYETMALKPTKQESIRPTSSSPAFNIISFYLIVF